MFYSLAGWRISFFRVFCAGAAMLGVVGDSTGLASTRSLAGSVVAPDLRAALVWHFDFDHPDGSQPDRELDQGPAGTYVDLVNGGEAMRVEDTAWSGSGRALQTDQVEPEADGNNDWKAGCYELGGVETLRRCSDAAGLTLMGWFKVTGPVPALNSSTPQAGDFYAGAGLVGVLSGASDGHFCRALLEILRVDGALRVVALGRRVDGGATQMGVWDSPWEEVLPGGRWTHLAAAFDYANGTIHVYRNGLPAPMRHHQPGNPWASGRDSEADRTSATLPAGIKIGGSYPQNHRERNPFNGRMDELMAFDRVLTADEVKVQFAQFVGAQNGIETGSRVP